MVQEHSGNLKQLWEGR